MRIEESFYGSFKVIDEFAFTMADILRAASLIFKSYRVRTVNWPITIDFNQKTEYWELWFTKPASDEEYVEHMSALALIDQNVRYMQENYTNDRD